MNQKKSTAKNSGGWAVLLGNGTPASLGTRNFNWYEG